MEDNLNFSVDRENESPILNNPLSSSLQASGKLNSLYTLYKHYALICISFLCMNIFRYFRKFSSS